MRSLSNRDTTSICSPFAPVTVGMMTGRGSGLGFSGSGAGGCGPGSDCSGATRVNRGCGATSALAQAVLSSSATARLGAISLVQWVYAEITLCQCRSLRY